MKEQLNWPISEIDIKFKVGIGGRVLLLNAARAAATE
ncbi:unnamed protein product [Arabidopsis halleri]